MAADLLQSYSQPVFEVRGLEVALGGRPVLGPLDLQIPSGAFLGVLGPNGSGKTTLLRALTGTVKSSAGETRLLGRPVRGYRSTELARLVGVVPQEFSLDFGFTVAETVAMGRYAHGGRGAQATHTGQLAPAPEPGLAPQPALAPDDVAVAAALAETGLSDLAGRLITQLSGGERQRALIAQTLAQESPILLLDEPLNNLDLNHQLEVMQLLSRLHKAGRTIVVVLHDLNMAAQYCEELALLDRGRLAARGEASAVLDPKVILDVFRVRVAVHRQGLRPYLTPVWSQAHLGPAEGGGAKVHVVAGGGAASELIEELVLHGFTPTVGIVSVFDTDYSTCERYELEVVSAPPFQAFPADTVARMKALAGESDVVVVAPVFFSTGNIDLLRVALETIRRGRPVIFVDADRMEERDLSGGEAASLVKESLDAGAISVANVAQAVEQVRSVAATPRR